MSMCLEMHSAPDATQIMWDSVNYPTVNKKSVYKHGQYCISGIAFRTPDNQDVAQCITIDGIKLNDTVSNDGTKLNNTEPKNFQLQLECYPGKSMCIYQNKEKEYFKLNCECGLFEDKGYCPIPK